MRRKFQYLLAGLCIYSHINAQQPVDTILQPFLLPDQMAVRSTQSTIKNNFLPGNYAVKGILPDGVILRRKLSASISIVSLTDDFLKQNLQKNALLYIPVNNKWKLSPALLSRPLISKQKDERILLMISVLDLIKFEQRYSEAKGIVILSRYPATGSVQVVAPISWIETTALQDPNISFIATTRKAVTERELTGFDLSANKVNFVHRNWPGISGRGLTVSIKENKMDTADKDLHGRYLSSSAASPTIQTHATNMATIAAGAGNTFYTGKGVAWGAVVSSSDFANLLPDNIQQLQQLKVTVQNHSYGVGIENYYGADAAAYDAQLFQTPTLLHVFSAGNSGSETSTSGNYAGITGFANLTGSFKMAKNILTVGATDSFGTVALASSRGPAFDGRVKPELVALGEDGSSGAAAIVSGISLLVQDAWQQKKASLPASSSIKAILLNSATDSGPAGIDYVSGYGSANAKNALQTVALDRVFNGTISQSQPASHTINLPANARNLKLTICWTDPPAQANSFKALVNDIDMELYHPSSAQRWLPWVLNSNPNADTLKQPAMRKKDSLNNAEQITLDIPPAGIYEIQVKGFAVTGTQSYALAWQYDTLDHFVFTYPVKGDNLFPRQRNSIRWETTLPGTATLQYRVNTGNWKDASTTMDLSKRFFQWQAPDTLGALRLRILQGTREWLTDTVSLSQNLLINTGFNCPDSFLIYWQRAAVDSYQVYRLGQQYLERFMVVADTALVQLKKNNPNQYFTIAPILPFKTEGGRSYAFDYTQQQVGCYISGFIADPTGVNTARLSLQLGTTYQVSKIVFEKLGASGFVPVRTITPVISTQNITTETAGKGLNTYRAKIELQNGTAYYTQPEQVIIFAGQPYYVFPNPVPQGSPLRLLAEDTDDTIFILYDIHGRKVTEYKVNGFLNSIRLPLLQKGIYFYTILKQGLKLVSQQLIVL